MLKGIRTMTLACFAATVLLGYQQGLFAGSGTLDFDCEPYPPGVCIGVHCGPPVDCSTVDDDFCDIACGICFPGEGYLVGCDDEAPHDDDGFDCACGPAR
jgi:hypothetical protein